jgi:hypothetical protein
VVLAVILLLIVSDVAFASSATPKPGTSTKRLFALLPNATALVSVEPANRDGDTVTWVARGPAVKGAAAGTASWAASPEIPNGPSGECSTTVWRTFYQGGDSLRFTMSRSPEECNEVPRLIWTDNFGKTHKAPLPPLYDFNVSSIWMTSNYLVLGLDAEYELGSHAKRLAFWNLKTGALVVTPRVHWESSEWDRSVKKRLFNTLSSWETATVSEDAGRLTVRNQAECLQVWPAQRTYARCSGTG